MAEQTCEVGRGITLCYETFGTAGHPPLLLVMGLGSQMTAWPDAFCEALAGRGFQVIRFDNRDVGRSTAMPYPPPGPWRLLTRRFHPQQYRISDLAEDAAGLLRALGLAAAHVVGVSLGGMIGQTLAAEHPRQVRSLVSMMSTTGNRKKGRAERSLLRHLIAPVPLEREAYAEHAAAIFTAIGSPGYPTPPDELRARARRSHARGIHPGGRARQLAAVIASGDRTAQLSTIRAPTLVIHGAADRLIHRSGGEATAAAIPGARLITIDAMGHDLPAPLWPRLIEAIASHAHAADAAAVPVA